MICTSKKEVKDSCATNELKKPEPLQQPPCIAFQDISNISKAEADDMALSLTTEKLDCPRLSDGKKSLIYVKKGKNQTWSCVGKMESSIEKENRDSTAKTNQISAEKPANFQAGNIESSIQKENHNSQANLISDKKPANFQNGIFDSLSQIKSIRCQNQHDTDEDVVQPQILMSQEIGRRYKIMKAGMQMASNNKGNPNKPGDKPVPKSRSLEVPKSSRAEASCKFPDHIDNAASKQSCKDKKSKGKIYEGPLAMFKDPMYVPPIEWLTKDYDAEDDKIFIRPESKDVMFCSAIVPSFSVRKKVIRLNRPVDHQSYCVRK